MVDQASLKRPRSPTPEVNGRHQSATSAIRERVCELLHDAILLGELQAQLLAADARESLQKARAPAVMLTIGFAVGLAVATTLLFALAEGLVLQFHWETPLAYLVSGLCGSTFAGLLLWGAWRRAGVAIEVFLRSRSELSENIRWVKTTLNRRQRID